METIAESADLRAAQAEHRAMQPARPTYTAREAALIVLAVGVALSMPLLSLALVVWLW